MNPDQPKMQWSIKVARIAGTEVKIHLTFILLLAWVGLAYGIQSGAAEALKSVFFLIIVFLCVLLHEFGHVFAALRFGITTPKITLLPFGGIASMSRIPKKPFQELLVSIAGPLVNVVIAAILFVVQQEVLDWNPSIYLQEGGGFVNRLIMVNVVIVVFNLIPAFPLDGGRIFRAVLSFFLTREKATRIAAKVGQVLAIVGAALAIYGHQPILFVIAIFIYFAAGSEAVFVENEHALEGLTASDASMSEFHTLQMDDTVHHAIDLMLETSQPDFPVVNESGQCVSIATRNDLVHTLREEGSQIRIRDVVKTIPAQIDLKTPAIDAWKRLIESKLPAAAVVDEDGKLTRWLTAENISELIVARTAIREYLDHHISDPTELVHRSDPVGS